MSFIYKFYESKSHCVRDSWGRRGNTHGRNQVATRSQNRPIIPYQIRKLIHTVTRELPKINKMNSVDCSLLT